MKEYGNESISSLKGADRVRLRPGVILGSDSLDGACHAFFEILSNSIDEAKAGYGFLIKVKVNEDDSIEITDYGRGIPLDYNKNEKRYNWELVYCELYAGGKYKNNDYKDSLGLNGLGACATQYSSSFFDVDVYRDGYHYSLHFEKGKNIGGLKKEKLKNTSLRGTVQRFKPDPDVFTETKIPKEYFIETLQRQAITSKGIKFELDFKGQKEEFYYKNGIIEYLEEINIDPITPVFNFEKTGRGRDKENRPYYNVRMEIAFAFNNSVNLTDYYHNSAYLEHGGSPEKAVKSAFVYMIDEILKEKDMYKKNEGKISFSDIEDSLIFISSTFSDRTSYQNQTKKAIDNKFIQDFMNEAIREKLKICSIEQKDVFEKALNQILINKRSRESADRERLAIKNKLTKKIDTFNTKIKKFADCRSKDKNIREIYIVEGDSALSSVKLGRDSEFQAVIPVRGKILNCLKAPLHSIFKNDIIVDLINVLGCGVEIETKKHHKDLQLFDIDKLRWNKVIICTDADVDGYQIRTLILAMLYKLVPTLIKEGFVYIAETPLFEITDIKNSKTYFAYDEIEKINILKKIKGKYKIQRSKGLGENEPEMMWQTTMNPNTRRLIRVISSDDEKLMKNSFETFLGSNVTKRKDFITKYGEMYMERLDI